MRKLKYPRRASAVSFIVSILLLYSFQLPDFNTSITSVCVTQPNH
jgi:hypothetical protein